MTVFEQMQGIKGFIYMKCCVISLLYKQIHSVLKQNNCKDLIHKQICANKVQFTNPSIVSPARLWIYFS